jgi:predicted RND superfamily exporter protein
MHVSPSTPDTKNFNQDSGSFLERLLFKNRLIILLACAVITLFLGSQATRLTVNANFNKMIPVHQPFIVNYLAHYNDLQFQGNGIRIAVQANNGSIISAHYLDVLKRINDQVFLLPGVNRAYMTSLWTPSTRWLAVTPDGLQGRHAGRPARRPGDRRNL